jgi:hypothetical protein
MTPGGGKHHARSVETVAGLGRRKPSEPERLPLDRPEPCGLGGQMPRTLFTCAASAPHPVACCKRVRPRQRLSSRFRLSGRCLPRVAPHAAPTRKMRLTNFCNRLTKRAPSGLSDSQAHGRNLAALACPRVELRLTAMLQLRPDNNTPERAFRAVALTPAQARTLHGPGGASIAAPPRWVSR